MTTEYGLDSYLHLVILLLLLLLLGGMVNRLKKKKSSQIELPLILEHEIRVLHWLKV